MSLSDTAIRSFKPEQKLIHKPDGHGLFRAVRKRGFIDIHSMESDQLLISLEAIQLCH